MKKNHDEEKPHVFCFYLYNHKHRYLLLNSSNSDLITVFKLLENDNSSGKSVNPVIVQQNSNIVIFPLYFFLNAKNDDYLNML